MRKLAIVLLLAAGCRGEPPRGVVRHILISFNGAPRVKQGGGGFQGVDAGAFRGDLAFQLEVDEIGLAGYDPISSP